MTTKSKVLSFGIAVVCGISLLTLSGQYIGEKTSWEIPRQPCAWCGASNRINNINVHHIIPQHIRPDLSHDTNNMICLCRKCHFCLGHKHNWKNSVTNILKMIEEGKK